MWLEDVRLSGMWLCGVCGSLVPSGGLLFSLPMSLGMGYWLLVLLISIAIGN